MSESIPLHETNTSIVQEDRLNALIELAEFYAEAAWMLHRMGFETEAEEVGERFIDTVSMLIAALPWLKYVEGSAAVAAEKKVPGWSLAGEPGYIGALLGYIASPSCSLDPSEVIDDVAERLGYSTEANEELKRLSDGDCEAAKHIIALMLVVKPARRVGEDG